jgi:superfamily II DNA or RNA helicase
VAFVNQEGVACLIQSLDELKSRGIRGRILLSQYLNFTDPIALQTLSKLDNLEVRIATKGSMHAKGYYFVDAGKERFIIGSSNWTASALCTNTELNIMVETDAGSVLAKEITEEFEWQFAGGVPLTKQFISEYTAIYEQSRKRSASVISLADLALSAAQLEPNRMQQDALDSLESLRKMGKTKALVVSATGTGKTLLSAFHALKLGIRRLLFVVHRENIARAAMESYSRVFGSTRRFGLYTGNQRDLEADFVFSTVQTLSRANHLDRFAPDRFEYIIVDESHRAGAESYRTFLDHFTPSFLLGMTATPERTDGVDIFQYFDHNVAYEIRLQRALEEGMLCPFHYYGVTDLTIDKEAVDSPDAFNRLTAPERVNRVVEKAEFFGCYDGIIRGLIFCSRIEEAYKLSDELNVRGYRTLALSGSTTEAEREVAIQRLESPSSAPTKLDYILTVDIFNEGVDIPSVNQIILLRPTTSAIIFVQQLGRGLRKIASQEKYLTVIDFIGNYQSNYLIPIALYGDRSYDKDRLRKLMVSGNDGLPGSCTIDFDRISRERIFTSLNSANTLFGRDLRNDFNALKQRIGRVPFMMDFVSHDARDPAAFVTYSKSFYNFARAIAPDSVAPISERGIKFIEALSYDSFNGKSLEEPLLLRALLENQKVFKSDLDARYRYITGLNSEPGRWDSAFRSVNLRFIREKLDQRLISVGEKLGIKLIAQKSLGFERLDAFEELLEEQGLADFLKDLCAYACAQFLREFDSKNFSGGFCRYRKYRRADVFRILGANENPVAQNVGGYQISPDQKWCPLFVTYKKEETISATTQYEDEFLNPSQMRWFTKSRRTLRSPDVQFFQTATQEQRILLFVQKSNDEGLEFYYVGNVMPDRSTIIETKMKDDKGTESPVVRMTLDLDKPVEESLYQYITDTGEARSVGDPGAIE